MNYLIFEDNGNVLWTESIRAASDEEAIEKAAALFENLTPEEKKSRLSFLLCEGYDAGEICGGFYSDEDSEGSWVIEREIFDFLED